MSHSIASDGLFWFLLTRREVMTIEQKRSYLVIGATVTLLVALFTATANISPVTRRR